MGAGAVKAAPAVTPWFNGSVKPVRAGVYERKLSCIPTTCYWYFNGRHWCFGGDPDPSHAWSNSGAAYNQDLPWRGLAADPAKAGGQ